MNRGFDYGVNGVKRIRSFSEIDKIVEQMERGEQYGRSNTLYNRMSEM